MSVGYVLDEGDRLQEEKNYIPREKRRSLVEVHVSGICFRNEGHGRTSVLLCRRSEDRELYPGKFEGCGGQLLPGEKFQEGVARHYREDIGLRVGVTDIHELYTIPTKDGVINGLKFLCFHRNGEPSSSLYSKFQWYLLTGVRRSHLREISSELVPGLVSEIERFYIRIPHAFPVVFG